MSGERGQPGERGPTGDKGAHGQHGDTGDEGPIGERGRTGTTGDTGLTGERGKHGDTGSTGETGARGVRGPSNWQSYVAMGLAVAAAFVVFLKVDSDRQREQARSALSNCQQIEIVKTEIRHTVEASVRRLPRLAYYRDHPDELGPALRDAKASVARFAALDCYALPAVRAADLKPPK